MDSGLYSYDVLLLGLRDASSKGRRLFLSAMGRLTGRDQDEFEEQLRRTSETLFTSLDRDQAQMALNMLDEAGAHIEIRPSETPPAGGEQQMVATYKCPSCKYINSAESDECLRCGLVFAKWERESVQRMQREQRLEEAMQRAMQVREEWTTRAKAYLENHPLSEQKVAPFVSVLLQDETPFLGLNSDEGPLMMTSRRLLHQRSGGIGTVPYELVADVDFGGGLVQRKGRTRIHFTMHAAIPMPGGDPDDTISWWLDKESMFSKDVIMDWAFARNFICGSCGAHDLDFRNHGENVYFRCMHCATDHEIDLVESLAIPNIQEG